MKNRKNCPGQDSRSCRDWVPSGCTGLPCSQQHISNRQKSQALRKLPHHGDISGFYVRVYDELHGNYILKPVTCENCKGDYR